MLTPASHSGTAHPPCPLCGGGNSKSFYSVSGVPVHSVRLCRDAEESLAVPRGDITLQYCPRCTFIWNSSFHQEAMEYDDQYEETQGYSDVFNRFQRQLARDLVDRYDLMGKRIVEVGCGKGEFLTLLSNLGIGEGIGFDPGFDAARLPTQPGLTFRTEFYPPASDPPDADFICCNMTLEHIPRPTEFMRSIRSTLRPASGQTVFLMVPQAERVLEQCAFWDIYHEHCCYFSRGSLTYLLESSGFEVSRIDDLYTGQYIGVAAIPVEGVEPRPVVPLDEAVDGFAACVDLVTENWKRRLGPIASRGGLLVWGAASKAVALVQSCKTLSQHCRLTDINPHKQGTYLPSTPVRIESPDELDGKKFELILVANPVYESEVREILTARGIGGKIAILR